jgi:hypothetical protein
LGLFGAMVWMLLIIEPFFQWIIFFLTKICIGIWGHSWCCWKALDKLDLIEFISQISKQRYEKYFFSKGFYLWKFQQIAKNGFRRKNQLSPRCVDTWVNGIGSTSRRRKKKMHYQICYCVLCLLFVLFYMVLHSV